MSDKRLGRIDYDTLPERCGKCGERVSKDAWTPRIAPGAMLMGLKISRGVSMKCKCGNEMYSGILPT